MNTQCLLSEKHWRRGAHVKDGCQRWSRFDCAILKVTVVEGTKRALSSESCRRKPRGRAASSAVRIATACPTRVGQ
eukprot:425819-Amphidinium_carterae.2